MIFAAGLGTRLKPLTDTRPKALVEVNGRPLIEGVMQKLVGAGFNRIVVNVHHFAPMLTKWIESHPLPNAETLISDESAMLLDTGGGLKHAAPLFCADRPILIHNVDIMSNVDLAALYSHQSHDAVLLVSKRTTKRYLLFDDDMRLVGWHNVETGEVRSPYQDINPKDYHMYAFSGIHVFSPRLFPLMDSFADKFGIIDFYLKVCAQADIHGLVKTDLRLLDVGKIGSLEEAAAFGG